MPEIQIDTSQLTSPLFAIPEAGTGFVGGPSATQLTLSLPARTGYHIQQGSALIGDFEFDVKENGTVDFDVAFDAFLSGRGEHRLTVRGFKVNVVVKVYVHPTEPTRSAPQGTVTFTVDGRLVGGATLDASGAAQTQISLLPLGDHDIVIEYQGDSDSEPSSTVVRHRVA